MAVRDGRGRAIRVKEDEKGPSNVLQVNEPRGRATERTEQRGRAQKHHSGRGHRTCTDFTRAARRRAALALDRQKEGVPQLVSTCDAAHRGCTNLQRSASRRRRGKQEPTVLGKARTAAGARRRRHSVAAQAAVASTAIYERGRRLGQGPAGNLYQAAARRGCDLSRFAPFAFFASFLGSRISPTTTTSLAPSLPVSAAAPANATAGSSCALMVAS